MAGIIAAVLGVIALAWFLRRLFPALFAAVFVLAAPAWLVGGLLLDLLRRPELDYARLTSVAAFAPAVDDPAVAEQVEIEARYSGYLERQREEIVRAQRQEGMAIPDGFDYAAVRGLSAEVRQKFERVRPQTVGQARRIPGVTPAAISLLLVHLARAHREVA